jgi:plasmid stabilization system protein ParE
MPRGDKDKYTDKQKRQAEHIAAGYEDRGVSEKEAKSRAWATVNEMTGGGKKSGSGRGKAVDKSPAVKGGKKGGEASANRSPQERSESAQKGAATRKKKATKSTKKKAAPKKSTKKKAATKKATKKKSTKKKAAAKKGGTKKAAKKKSTKKKSAKK